MADENKRVPYAEIRITVWAKESDVNGSAELKLSDDVASLEGAVQDFVEHEPNYDFEYEVGTC